MSKKFPQEEPSEFPIPIIIPDIDKPLIPELPIAPDEDPDIAPDEDPFEFPPYEIPEPGEGL